MTQIKKGNYIITIARVDGTIYIRSTGSVPKDIKQIIRQLNLNIWLSEEKVSETLLKEIECREMRKCKKKTPWHRLQEVKIFKLNKAMREAEKAMREAEEKIGKEQAENEKAIFKEIRNLVSAYKVRKLREYMSDTHYWNLKIVDTHGAVKPQDESYWFKKAYVSQSCGYSGDDYSGTIWIPLPNGKYLEFLFFC